MSKGSRMLNKCSPTLRSLLVFDYLQVTDEYFTKASATNSKSRPKVHRDTQRLGNTTSKRESGDEVQTPIVIVPNEPNALLAITESYPARTRT